jgi:hypothetical protein
MDEGMGNEPDMTPLTRKDSFTKLSSLCILSNEAFVQPSLETTAKISFLIGGAHFGFAER